MESCSRDVLAHISNFLPWKDRLRITRLSSLFRGLPSQKPTKLFMLKIAQTEDKPNSIDFVLSTKGREGGTTNERRYLRIIKDKEKEIMGKEMWPQDPFCPISFNGKVFEEEVIVEDPQAIVKTTFRKLLSIFTFEKICLINLKPEVYSSLTQVLTEIGPDVLKETCIDFKTKNRRLTEEEFSFLASIDELYGLNFEGPNDSQEVKELFDLNCVKTAKSLGFIFELSYRLNFYYPSSRNIARIIEVDDDFLMSLIERKVERFTSNVYCTVTKAFILYYIQNCTKGEHALHVLKLRFVNLLGQRFGNVHALHYAADLRGLGFEETGDDLWTRYIKEDECIDGKKRDQIKVEFKDYYILIEADYDIYKTRRRNYNE